MPNILIHIFFFVSGACGLAYEIVWMRRLSLLMGASTPAVSIVLAAFMGGLAIGARLWGAVADRRRQDALRLYGWLEIGIAAYALLVPLLLQAGEAPYVSLAQQLAGRPLLLGLVRVLAAGLLLAPPTILMGGTLPLLVRHLRRDGESAALGLGRLYTVNLAGAMTGTLVTGFVAIRLLGLAGTEAAAALLNAAVGGGALLLARRSTPDETTRPDVDGTPSTSAPGSPGLVTALWLMVGLSGLTTMGLEVLWSRVLVFPLTSTVYTFTVILATFLGGLALGGAAFTVLVRRGHGIGTLAVTQVAAGCVALVTAPLVLQVPGLVHGLARPFGFSGGAFVLVSAVVCAVVMLPAAALMGLVFPFGMHLLATDARTVGRRIGLAYVANTAGCIAGSLGAGYVLMPWLGLKHALLAMGLLQAGIGLALLTWSGPRRKALAAACAASITLAWLAGPTRLPGPNPFDQGVAPPDRPGAPRVLAHHDDVTGSVTVLEDRAGLRVLRIDGFTAASDGSAADYMATLAHVPLLAHPAPRDVLVICFGTGTTAGSVLLHEGTRLEVVDLNRTVIGMADLFARTNHGVAKDPRARLVVDDGRHHLLTTRRRYDVITSEPMPPGFAGVVSLYSREYYELAASRLNHGGVLAQWLPFHLVTTEHGLAILRTVQSVFPETTLWLHRGTGVIVARRDAPVGIDGRRVAPGRLEADLRHRGLGGGATGMADAYMLGPDEVRRLTARAGLVTDNHPSLEFQPPKYAWLPPQGPATENPAAVQTALVLEAARTARLPLTGVGADEAEVMAADHALQLVLLRADLMAQVGLWAEAEAELERALASAPAGARRTRLEEMLGVVRARIAGATSS